MPRLHRPDGAEIAWREEGEGPVVAVAGSFFQPQSRLRGLIDELHGDHRVVSFDPRGVGESSAAGPYEFATDAADLEVLIRTLGGPAVLVGLADGCNRSVRVGASCPDLVAGVVLSGTPALSVAHAEGTDSLVASSSVLKALVGMIEVDHRAGVRQIVTTGDANLSEGERRAVVDESVAYCSQEVMVQRMRAWIEDDATDPAQELGERLWILHYPGNPWFPTELTARLGRILPRARLRSVDDGAIQRPDLTAGAVREITRSLAAADTVGS